MSDKRIDPRLVAKLRRMMGVAGGPPVDPVAEEMAAESLMGASFDGVPAREMVRGGMPVAGEDDWDAQLRRKGEAAYQHPGDDLSASIAEKDIHRKELESIARFVRTVPPSSVGITQGASAVLSADGVLFTNDLLFHSGEDIESQPITVTFAPPLREFNGRYPTVQTAGSNNSYRYFGRVRFGNRATQSVVDVDLGQSLTVVASSCYAQLSSTAPPTGYVAGSATLSAALAFGVRAGALPVTLTTYIDDLGAGATTIPVAPTWAKKLSVIRTPITGAITIYFMDVGSTTTGRVQIAANTAMTTPIAVPGDTYFWQLENNGASTIQARAVWELGGF